LKALIAAQQIVLKEKDTELKEKDTELQELESYRKAEERRSLRTLLTLEDAEFKLQGVWNEASHMNGARARASATVEDFKSSELEEKDLVQLQ
jgi:hypothetical protein